MSMRGSPSDADQPASMTPTRNGVVSSDLGAESLFATTSPAVPPPTIMTSNSVAAKDTDVDGFVMEYSNLDTY